MIRGLKYYGLAGFSAFMLGLYLLAVYAFRYRPSFLSAELGVWSLPTFYYFLVAWILGLAQMGWGGVLHYRGKEGARGHLLGGGLVLLCEGLFVLALSLGFFVSV